MKHRRPQVRLSFQFLFCLLVSATAFGQSGNYDWTSQNLNIKNSRYAELDQINKSNVTNLAESWTYSPGPQDSILQVTPLVANGVMYLHSANTMFALNAASGEELWRRPLDRGPPRPPLWRSLPRRWHGQHGLPQAPPPTDVQQAWRARRPVGPTSASQLAPGPHGPEPHQPRTGHNPASLSQTSFMAKAHWFE